MVDAKENATPASQNPLVLVLSGTSLAFFIATIVLAVQKNNLQSSSSDDALSPVSSDSVLSNVPDNKFYEDIETIFQMGENTCSGANPKFENVDCVHLPGPQAAANVTKGYVGGLEVDVVPNLKNYWQSSMCPVNVHWHLGTEHYSMGEYDENGTGPHGGIGLMEDSDDPDEYHDGQAHLDFANMTDDEIDSRRDLADMGGDDHEVRGGFRCHHYDADDEKFTAPYEWKHCKHMEVGETYEVHWPHSAAGACGTVDQYQTPFYDGVFCNLDLETFSTLNAQDVASAVGVQAQIYTIVNDESYFYPDLIRGWVVDDVDDMGQDIAYYTGSTTGTSRSNEICSQYTPITWQVDRKCHMISASSFDKLCYDMKLQRDDMSSDLHAHGARELVKDSMVANNQARKLQHDHAHGDDHTHGHAHVHGHTHDDHEEHTHTGEQLSKQQMRHLRAYGHYHKSSDHQEWY